MSDAAIDREHMRRAVECARLAWGNTRPNPHVGCVIVRDGRTIAEGHHPRAGEPHAERVALAACAEDPRGATLYVTLEPCNHHGRTPPCTEAILAAGIARVVIAQRDPNAIARGGVERLRAAGVEVDVGVLEDEARLLNPAFNAFHEMRRPLVTLKWASSLDGCTSCDSGHSAWITPEVARHRAHVMRAAHDAVMIGIETAIEDGARLTVRGVTLPPGPPLRRVVLDSSLRLPVDHPLVRETQGVATIICADDADKARESALRDAGADVWRVARGAHGLELNEVMAAMRRAGIQSLMVEGGRRVAGAMRAAGLADRVAVFLGFRVIGAGERAISALVSDDPIDHMQYAPHVLRPSIEAGGDWLLIEGWLRDPAAPFAEAAS